MRTDRDAPSRPPSVRSRLGWAGLLTGPTAWMAHLIGSWALGEVIGCAPGNSVPGAILGIGLNGFIGIVDAVLLGVTVLAGVGSFVELRRLRRGSDPTPGGRATWLATAGLMTSVLFAVLIATSFVPIGLIRGCG